MPLGHISNSYFTLCHNTYGYSLLFYKVYMKRENAGSWDSGLEKEQILETYSTQLQKSWNFTEAIFGINKKYWWKNQPEGGHPPSTRVEGAPGRRPVPIFCYMKSFALEKIVGKLTRWNSAAMRRNLGGTNLGLWRSCSTGETSLQEGEIITIVITNDPLTGRGSISINIFTSTISSQTLVHLLYPIFVPKPHIGTCGLLVVLITPCSWC